MTDWDNYERGVIRPDPVTLLNEVIHRRPGNQRNRKAIRGLAYTVDGSLLDDLAAEIELLREAVINGADALPGEYVLLVNIRSATDRPSLESYGEPCADDIVLLHIPYPRDQT